MRVQVSDFYRPERMFVIAVSPTCDMATFQREAAQTMGYDIAHALRFSSGSIPNDAVFEGVVRNDKGEAVTNVGELNDGDTVSVAFDIAPAPSIRTRELQFSRRVLEAHARAVATDHHEIPQTPPRLHLVRRVDELDEKMEALRRELTVLRESMNVILLEKCYMQMYISDMERTNNVEAEDRFILPPADTLRSTFTSGRRAMPTVMPTARPTALPTAVPTSMGVPTSIAMPIDSLMGVMSEPCPTPARVRRYPRPTAGSESM